jgi:hypothetical protein
MGVRTGLTVLVAAALPLASVSLLEGTAHARGLPTGSGTITCHVGGTINFSPLFQNATPERVNITSIDLVGSGSCRGQSSSPSSITFKPIKVKLPKGLPVETCAGGPLWSNTTVSKGEVTWNNVKPSKFIVNGMRTSLNDEHETGFTAHPAVKGSFAGSGTLAVYLTEAETNAVAACSEGLSTVNIDPATSTATL